MKKMCFGKADVLLPDFIGDAGAIYDSYCAGGGRELVCMAYLSYFANCYLTRDMVIPDNVFLQIEQLLQKNAELNAACRIGFFCRRRMVRYKTSNCRADSCGLYWKKYFIFLF